MECGTVVQVSGRAGETRAASATVAAAAARMDGVIRIAEEFEPPLPRAAHPGRRGDDADGMRADVGVVGLGADGIDAALDFAEAGAHVAGFDLSRDVLDDIAAGRAPVAPADRGRLARALADGQLSVGNAMRAVAEAEIVVVATPVLLDAHQTPDIAPLVHACADVVRLARPGRLILVRSLAYAGATADLVAEPLRRIGLEPGRDVNVAFVSDAPRAAEAWSATRAFVVGGVTDACAARAADVVARLGHPVHRVASPEAAELSAVAGRAVRAVHAAALDEVVRACAAVGVPAEDVLGAAPGTTGGFAGDDAVGPRHLMWQLRRHRLRVPTIESAVATLDERPARVARAVERRLAAAGIAARGARVAVAVPAPHSGRDARPGSPLGELLVRLVALGIDVTVTERDPVDAAVPDGGSPAWARSAADLLVVCGPPGDDVAGAARVLYVDDDLGCVGTAADGV